MKIGELSKTTKTPIETIRFYERMGLLEAPQRTASNYRRYTGAAIQRLHFIQSSQKLGFSLNEIKQILEKNIPSDLSAKISNLNEKLVELARAKEALESLLD